MGFKSDEEKEFKNKLGKIVNGESPKQETSVAQPSVPENNAPNNAIEETIVDNNAN